MHALLSYRLEFSFFFSKKETKKKISLSKINHLWSGKCFLSLSIFIVSHPWLRFVWIEAFSYLRNKKVNHPPICLTNNSYASWMRMKERNGKEEKGKLEGKRLRNSCMKMNFPNFQFLSSFLHLWLRGRNVEDGKSLVLGIF